MPNPPPSFPELSAYLASHGFPHEPLTLAEPAGITSHVIRVGSEVVVKVSKDPALEDDFRTEVAAAMAMDGAGIKAPRLLHWDPSRSQIDGLVQIWEFCPGTPLATQTWSPTFWRPMARDLGAEIAKWQALTVAPHPHFDEPSQDTWEPYLVQALQEGRVLPHDEAWFRSYGAHLSTALASPAPTRFVHDDVHSGNIHVTPRGEFVAVIDWGDAGLGDPALDFHTLLAPLLPDLVAGYEGGGGVADQAFAGRVIHAHFCRCLGDFARPWVGDWLTWTGRARWEAFEAFFSSNPGGIWTPWLPR